MIYNWRGKQKPSYGKLFDANDVQLANAFWCDTETGEYRCYVRDEGGRYMLDESGTDMAFTVNYAPAPLRFEPFVTSEV